METTATRLFISHSTKDERLVEALANAALHGLSLRNSEIRCTSVSGFKPPAGSDIREGLRYEATDSDSMLAILTENSLSSSWVQFEMGARWGAKLHLVLLIAGSVGFDLIPGPLQNKLAKRCTKVEIEEAFEAIADQLNLKWSGPSARRFIEEAESISKAQKVFASGRLLPTDSQKLVEASQSGKLGGNIVEPRAYDRVDRHMTIKVELERPEVLEASSQVWICVESGGEIWPKNKIDFVMGKAEINLIEGGNPPQGAFYLSLRILNEDAIKTVNTWTENGILGRGFPGFKSIEGSSVISLVPVVLTV